jgi:hypothetical protein
MPQFTQVSQSEFDSAHDGTEGILTFQNHTKIGDFRLQLLNDPSKCIEEEQSRAKLELENTDDFGAYIYKYDFTPEAGVC